MVDNSSLNPEERGQTVRRLLTYLQPHKLAVAAVFLAMVFDAIGEAAVAWLMKLLTDWIFVRQDPRAYWVIPGSALLLFAFRGVFAYAITFLTAYISRHLIHRLREQVFERFLTLPTRVFEAGTSGSLLSKLTFDIENVAHASASALTILVRDTLKLIALLSWMIYLDWKLSLVFVVVAPTIAILVSFVSRLLRHYSRGIQESMGDVTHVAEEVISGQRVVKVFQGQEEESDRFSTVNEHNRRLNMKLHATEAASSALMLMISGFGLAAIIYFAIRTGIEVDEFNSFFAAMLLLMSPLRNVVRFNVPLQRGLAAARSVFELLDQDVEDRGGRHDPGRVEGRIAFRDLNFRYREDKPLVFEGMELEIQPGETVALVGRSGSGKSTLVSLLPRLYDPSSGRIELDGRDLRDYDLGALRRQIALVSQDVVLFNDSIAGNIAYGELMGASREAIEQAARMAHVLEFTQGMEQGLDTQVGDRGVLLSGGQRQRIAIARALLKDAPVLVLDEATSALDTESERAIQDALEQLMKDRTTLVIAHRLSTVEKADRVLVMNQGRVVEQGTHAELIAHGGEYASLHAMQFRDEG